MTIPTNKAELAFEISNFITRLWEEIEQQEGSRAAEYFAADGVFDSKMVCFRGQQEIRDWFAWRRDKVRTARHLLTNFHFDFSKWESDQEIEVRAVMTHYGEYGKGVLPIGDPIGIYDHRMRARQGGIHGWTIHLLENDPVFLAPDHVALSYKGATRPAVAQADKG
jgi:hypothetical protein